MNLCSVLQLLLQTLAISVCSGSLFGGKGENDMSKESEATGWFKLDFLNPLNKIGAIDRIPVLTWGAEEFRKERSHIPREDGERSHMEEAVPTEDGERSHMEGAVPTEDGERSHMEGAVPTEDGERSHMEGAVPTEDGERSHLEGAVTAEDDRKQNNSTEEVTEKYDKGFNLLFTTNEDLLRDYEMTFEKPVASWLKGNYLHTGPGQFEMGSRSFVHVFDGFSKLNKLSFGDHGEKVAFSTRFTGTSFYNQSLTMDDVAPYLVFDSVKPPFDFWEKVHELVNGIDNPNTNILRLANKLTVVSDFWKFYEIDPTTLHMINEVSPSVPGAPWWSAVAPATYPSTSHPVPEFNTSDYISFVTVMSPFKTSSVNVVRIRSSTEQDLLATLERPSDKVPYMHSLAASRNYAVIFMHPFFMNLFELLASCNSIQSVHFFADAPTDAYIVRLKDGKVTKMVTDAMVFTHHVNSYEVDDDDTIIIDYIVHEDGSFFKTFTLPRLRNPERRDSIKVFPTLKRFTISLSQNKISYEDFPSTPGAEFVNHFEMPVINEAFRHRKHCYVYGIAFKIDGQHMASNALVKKDVCNPGNDRAWTKPSHYMSEPVFVPRPGSQAEDDGLLLSKILDGEKGASYLGIFNPKTMELDNVGYLPLTVPFLLHGQFFASEEDQPLPASVELLEE